MKHNNALINKFTTCTQTNFKDIKKRNKEMKPAAADMFVPESLIKSIIY